MTLTKTWIGSALATSTLFLAGCGGGGDSPSGVVGTGSNFQLLRVTPPNNSILFLNDAIQFDFSTNVDLSTADFNSVAVSVFDLAGQALGEQPRGTFRLAAPAGDDAVGRRLELVPLLPTDDLFSNGGFKPGRRYVVQLVGGERRNGTILKGTNGRELESPIALSFTTVDGSTSSQLFRNTKPGGPRRSGFEVRPSTASANGVRVVDLSANSTSPLEVRLSFDQPLNPQSANTRGRVYLEYDDPSVGGDNLRIPADMEIESNSLEGSLVVLRPIGVLPNNAVIDVRVLNTLEDMSGESNVSDAAYTDLFAQFVVQPRHEPQFDALVERFEGNGSVDLSAAFVEPLAEVGDGYIRASLAFEGEDTSVDFEPRDINTVLNTDFTQINLRSGRSVNVSGGLFAFRNVTIPEGYTVVGQGTKPMVWLVTGDMTIAGTLTVSGGNGEVVTSTSADVPSAGGIGQCGGGNGGRGSVVTTARTDRAETGFGPDGVTNGGGQGGQHSCRQDTQPNGCRIGSGGGGGSFATRGDPDFYTRFVGANTVDVDMRGGDGRAGCQNKSTANLGVAPGTAGAVGMTDADANNDFFGAGLRISTDELVTTRPTRRITGELASPRGGSGGGGGGDGAADCNNPANWRNDAKGGGGGGGAGVLIIKCLGKVKILSRGRVTANGGYGGGGAPNGSSSAPSGAAGGGGGAGAGGMVVIMCSELNMVKHGETYANASATARSNGAYDFAIMADGGVGLRRPGTLPLPIRGKYPTEFQTADRPEESARWQNDIGDQPVGGFGGNGVVQIMTPSRRSVASPEGDSDNSGAYFDDSIVLFDTDANLNATPPVPSTMADKVRYVGWRGYRKADGSQMNDRGAPITILRTSLGDIKPAPILLPAPFGATTRVQSGLIDLGRVDRVGVNVAQGVRTVQEVGTSAGDPFTNLLAGPTYLFAGTSAASTSTYRGYLNFDSEGVVAFPVVAGSRSEVARIDASASFNQRTAYAVSLTAANALLGQIPGRYTGYMAKLLGTGGTTVGEFRVLGHDASTIYLDARQGALPAVTVASVELAAKFVSVDTSGAPGLGGVVRNNGVASPSANVRIGFAFYAGASNSLTRYPTSGFEYGLSLDDPELMRTLRSGRYRYVQYDVLFNSLFSPDAANNTDTTRRLTPVSARPTLRELVLPFQF